MGSFFFGGVSFHIFWFLGFLASRLLVGLCVWWLWLFASSAFPVPLRAVLLLRPFWFFGFGFLHRQDHQFLPI